MLVDGKETDTDVIPLDSKRRTYVMKDGVTYKINDGTTCKYGGETGILKAYKTFLSASGTVTVLEEGNTLTIKDNNYFGGVETDTIVTTTVTDDVDVIYNAIDIQRMYSLAVHSGFKNIQSTDITVDGLVITFQPTEGIIDGLAFNKKEQSQLTITGGLSQSRVDLVVLRKVQATGKVTFEVKQGATGSTQAPKADKTTLGVYELEVCTVRVSAGVSSLQQADIADVRKTLTTTRDDLTGFDWEGIPLASGSAINKGDMVKYREVAYIALTDVSNPFQSITSANWTDYFYPVPTLGEATKNHLSLTTYNSFMFDVTNTSRAKYAKLGTYSNNYVLYGLLMDGHELGAEETAIYNTLAAKTRQAFFTTSGATVKTRDYRGRFTAYQSESTYLRTTPPNETGTNEPANVIGAIIGDGTRLIQGSFEAMVGNVYAGTGLFKQVLRTTSVLVTNKGVGGQYSVTSSSERTTPTTPTNRPDGVVLPLPLLQILDRG